MEKSTAIKNASDFPTGYEAGISEAFFSTGYAYGKALKALSAEAESLEGFTQLFHRLKPMEKPCKTAKS